MVCTSDFRGSFYVSDSSWPWPSQAGPAVCAQAGWLQVKSCPSPHEYYSCELRGEVQSFGMAHLSGLSKQCHKCDSGSWLLVQLKKEIRVFELVYMFIVLCHERFFSFFVEFFFSFCFLIYFSEMVGPEPTNSQTLIHLLVQGWLTIAPPIRIKQMGKGDVGHCLDFWRKESSGQAEQCKFIWFLRLN